VLTDVALDPYTSHGQDGLVDDAGYVINDDTVAVLVDQAINQAQAGADIIAPSDMMDGRIRRDPHGAGNERAPQCPDHVLCRQVRQRLLRPVPRRGGIGGLLKGDKKTYQMDPANGEEALREVALDIAEGADSVMVKPGLPYLDIVAG
jgi:porphobilinogen synthase